MADEADERVPTRAPGAPRAAPGEGAPRRDPNAPEPDELEPDARARLQRWEPAAPPPSFAERIEAARHAADTPASARAPRRGRLAIVRAGAAVAVAVAAGAVALLRLHGGAPVTLETAERTLATRESLALAGRGIAVAEPGATLRWSRRGAALRVEQAAGEVFYRVEPGGPFTVATAAGEVRVTGTCFRVEVLPMKLQKQALIGAAVGATLAAAVVITVYEGKVVVAEPGGQAQVSAGERVTLPLAPSAPPAASASGEPATGDAPALAAPRADAPREELLARDRQLRAQVAELTQQVAQLAARAPKVRGGPPDRKDRSWLHPSPQQLLAWAKECRVQFDVGAPQLDPERIAAASLSAAEAAAANQALRDLDARWTQRVRDLYVEATGDARGADSLSMQAMSQELRDKALDHEDNALRQRLAEERAGLRRAPAPEVVAKASAFERYFRALVFLGDEQEHAIGAAIGLDKARQVREFDGGWPSRSVLAGCPKGGRDEDVGTAP